MILLEKLQVVICALEQDEDAGWTRSVDDEAPKEMLLNVGSER